MRIVWDEEKNRKLMAERGVSFEEAATCILNGEILDIMKNPSYPGQFYFILILNGYTHVVPYKIGSDDEIILKTIFPSRKFHKRYAGKI
jgi:uncharacterized DUF497 family protein